MDSNIILNAIQLSKSDTISPETLADRLSRAEHRLHSRALNRSDRRNIKLYRALEEHAPEVIPYIKSQMVSNSTINSNFIDAIYGAPDDKQPDKPSKASVQQAISELDSIKQDLSEASTVSSRANGILRVLETIVVKALPEYFTEE